MFKRLRNRLLTWLITRSIVDGFDHLKTLQLGQRLNSAMDKKLGVRSNALQLEMAEVLERWAKELRA